MKFYTCPYNIKIKCEMSYNGIECDCGYDKFCEDKPKKKIKEKNERRKMKIVITKDSITHLYDDKLVGLQKYGKTTIKRASNVEPNKDGKWIVDLSPIGLKKKLGPFDTRKEALEKEHVYIEENYL